MEKICQANFFKTAAWIELNFSENFVWTYTLDLQLEHILAMNRLLDRAY